MTTPDASDLVTVPRRALLRTALAGGVIAIGGGAYSTGGYLEESQNAAVGAIGPTWRLACKNSAGTRIQCTSPSAISARLGS